MKKLMVTAAVLSYFASFGMEVSEKFSDFVREWSEEITAPYSAERIEKDWDEFTSKPFKEKLLAEIGNDPPARKAFGVFHSCSFPKFLKHYETNRESMLPLNAEKFRELLILLAPMIDLVPENEPYVKRIIEIAGNIKSVVDYYSLFPQFSYEMFFCVMFDAVKRTHRCKKLHKSNEIYLQASKAICEHIAFCSDWPLKEEELLLLLSTSGCREDALGLGYTRLWNAARYSYDEERILAISRRLFGDDDH